MRLLVTGGAGFIGSNSVRVAVAAGHQVCNVDKLTYAGSRDNLADLVDHPAHRFAPIDICDGPALRALFAEWRPDAVMHLAAETHVDRSIDGPAAFVQTNVVGTSTLLEVARGHVESLPAAAAREFRFHHISTDEVYGELGDTGLFSEISPYDPHSPYAASKAGSDMLVRAWHRTYGLPILITNCSNNYGPYQYPEKLIPVVVLNALAGKPIPVYGTGRNVRDWLYVEDHARALLEVLARGRVGETYNVGGRSERTNVEIVERVCAILDELEPAGAPHDRLISFVSDRPGHDFRYAIDDAKLRDELGWAPAVGFDDGLRRTVRWYRDNRAWCRRRLADREAPARLGLGQVGTAAVEAEAS